MTDTPPAVLPPDPEKSGWHWIRGSGGNEFPSEWSPDPYAPMQIQGWWTVQNGRISDRHAALHGFAYIAPLDPPGTGAALDEARAEVARLRKALDRATRRDRALQDTIIELCGLAGWCRPKLRIGAFRTELDGQVCAILNRMKADMAPQEPQND